MSSPEKSTVSRPSLVSNPFLALFTEDVPEVKKPVSPEKPRGRVSPTVVSVCYTPIPQSDDKNKQVTTSSSTPADETEQILNDLLQRVFLVSIDLDNDRIGCKQVCGLPRRCVYLRDTAEDASVIGKPLLSFLNMDQALMERLTMHQPRNSVMVTGRARSVSLTAEIEAGEAENIKYLAACYKRAKEDGQKLKEKYPDIFEQATRAKKLSVSYAGTCLLSPEMFHNQDCHRQLFRLLLSSQGDRTSLEFMEDFVKEYHSKEETASIFSPVVTILAEHQRELVLVQPQTYQYLDMLMFFARHSQLAELLMSSNSWFPPRPPQLFGTRPTISGRAFEKQTLIGAFLSLTSISADPTKPSEYFQRPAEQSQHEMQATMANLRTQLDVLCSKLQRVMFELLRTSPSGKHKVLYWIGACLYSNVSRKRMMSELFATTLADDGFFLNLGTVMLRLCQPFLDPVSPKLLKIDPRYCVLATNIDNIAKEDTRIHVAGLAEETMLTNPDNVILNETPPFGFVTECFFMTHYCLQLGLWKICEKYKKLMSELAQVQRVYQDASAQGGDNAIIGRLKVQFEKGIIQQLSLKTHLLNPSMIELALRFYIATASWLNQLALAGDDFREMTEFKEVSMPLPDQTPAGLLYVPEFVLENMADFIIFLKHFSEDTLETAGKSLHHLVTFFVIYMGSPERVKNPHLRAKLAEALEALVPAKKEETNDGPIGSYPVAMFHREQAFQNHAEAKKHLSASLLRLFVDIEFTGHTMQFEQKFGYRHHMYTILEYIWQQPEYKTSILSLCDEMETKRENSVILRFINLLINDAIFLLDESLSFMGQIKTKQAEQDSGQNENLPEQERENSQREFLQLGQMARSHNILACETVHTLNYLTTELKRPFLLPCVAGRMSAMLNYFLLHLVGPKMGTLKVKDFSEYHFKPQQLVSDIVDIYRNLGDNATFCRAVGSDERSYSPDLFVKAERVSKLIGLPATVIFELNDIARRIQEEVADIIIYPEPPEMYKDPIMDTLMENPVLLPTSGKVMDKDIICRHLLSDQKDPFNREPLEINMLIPLKELKDEITEWKETEKRKQKSEKDQKKK